MFCDTKLRVHSRRSLLHLSVFPSLAAPDMLWRKIYACTPYTLISTSTPLGNSNFIKASMVLEEEL